MWKLKIIFSFLLVFVLALTLVGTNLLVSPIPVLGNNGNPHLVKTFPGPNGKTIDEVVFPTKPPVDKVKSSIVLPPITTGVNYVSGSVPALDWSYGCSATSAAMLFGYYDRIDYSNFYTGLTNGGLFPLPTDSEDYWGYTPYPSTTCYECPLSATHLGVDGRAERGHVDDYWIDYGNNTRDPYIVNKWTQHTGDSVGDFMGTNQYRWHNSDASTTFYFNTDGSPLYDYSGSEIFGYRDGGHGMKLFAESKGYTVTTVYNQYIQGQGSDPSKGFTFANYVSEIDAGRPVLIQVSGHTMLGFGYDTTGNFVYLHNTWGFGDDYMVWGESYSGMQHYGVTVFRLAPQVAPGAPVPAFSGSPVTGTIPLTVNFTDQSTNTPTSWTWNFGDTATSSERNPSHIYETAGVYSVTLTAANATGSDMLTKTNYITVNAPAAPNFSLSVTPSSRNVNRGGSTTYIVTLTTSGGFNSAVGLSVSGFPSDATVEFLPPSLTSGTSTLKVTTLRTTSKGTFTLTITGTGGGLTRSVNVSLKVR